MCPGCFRSRSSFLIDLEAVVHSVLGAFSAQVVRKVVLSRMLFYKSSNDEEALGSGHSIVEGENSWAFLTNCV